MTALSLPALYPFTLAALVMAGLVLVEAMSLAVGHSASGLIDALLGHGPAGGFGVGHGLHVDHEGHSPATWLSWINIGRVPLLILLILGLAGFAVTGFLLQAAAGAVVAPLPSGVAAGLAALAVIPELHVVSRTIARLIPRDETYVVSADDLVGATAEVILGPLDAGLPGRVRAVDRYGNVHFLRARAAGGAPRMDAGARVLLVEHVADVYAAVPATPDL